MKLYNDACRHRLFRALPAVGRSVRYGIGASALLLFSTGNVLAQRIHVVVNGSPVRFEGMGPLQLEGRTLVPVRGVLEKLGAEVAWIEASQIVVASAPHMEIELHLGDNQATVNGKQVALDVPAQEINGHTMVPLRFLGEALGADVRWDDAARTVIIVTHERQRTGSSGRLQPYPTTGTGPPLRGQRVGPKIRKPGPKAVPGWLRQAVMGEGSTSPFDQGSVCSCPGAENKSVQRTVVLHQYRKPGRAMGTRCRLFPLWFTLRMTIA